MRASTAYAESFASGQASLRGYALGFLFNEPRTSVVLIKKRQPKWQAGLLNGVGGKIEPGETAMDAMIREFFEETGVRTCAADWRQFAVLCDAEFAVTCFVAFSTDAWASARTVLAEKVVPLPVNLIQSALCVSSLRWLIPLALDDHYGREFHAVIHYGESLVAGTRLG